MLHHRQVIRGYLRLNIQEMRQAKHWQQVSLPKLVYNQCFHFSSCLCLFLLCFCWDSSCLLVVWLLSVMKHHLIKLLIIWNYYFSSADSLGLLGQSDCLSVQQCGYIGFSLAAVPIMGTQKFTHQCLFCQNSFYSNYNQLLQSGASVLRLSDREKLPKNASAGGKIMEELVLVDAFIQSD